jgi:predicted O-methyltransferase YrrM
MIGTNAADFMLESSHLAAWGNPCWADTDNCSGGVMPGEGQLLYGIVRALIPKTIVEFGTSYGWSTIHLAAACRDNQFGHVYTVEIDDHRFEQAEKNINIAGLDGYVTQSKTPPKLKAVNLAFLDAGHTAVDVASYMESFQLANEGVVLIHDAEFYDHVKQVFEGWDVVFLPSSLMGLAIARRAKQC